VDDSWRPGCACSIEQKCRFAIPAFNEMDHAVLALSKRAGKRETRKASA
jgi:hypothetical protein